MKLIHKPLLLNMIKRSSKDKTTVYYFKYFITRGLQWKHLHDLPTVL